MYRLMVALAVAAAAATMGCSGDESVPVVTCELSDTVTHWCYEIPTTALTAEQVAAIQAACRQKGAGATVVTGTGEPCGATGSMGLGGSRVGVCAASSTDSFPYWYTTLPPGTSVKVSFYSPQVDFGMGALACAGWGGTWTP